MKDDRPFAAHLESVADEERISRMWSAIRRGRSPRAPSARTWLMAAAALAAVSAVATWLWPIESAPQPRALALQLADGRAFDVVTAGSDPVRSVLTDGSQIDLRPGARIEVMQNDEAHVSLLLRRGGARFSVRPGGPRRWVIEGGLATVEVIGTVFRVERESAGVRVSVEHGVVLVRGERVPERIQRLRAGESLFVEAEPVRPPPIDLAPAATSAPIARVPPTDRVTELFEQADRARRSGDPAAAVAPLSQAMRVRGDPRAALAAFTLGRIEMDELGHPGRAERAFRRALELGLPERLAEQAEQRLAELAGEER